MATLIAIDGTAQRPPDWLTAEIQQDVRAFLEQLAATGDHNDYVRDQFVTATAARPRGGDSNES